VPDRVVVHRVGGHARILTKRISGVKRGFESRRSRSLLPQQLDKASCAG
jgi:hypothetical protein